MEQKTIGFIGGGNMAAALIGGLVADGMPGNQVWVSDPGAQRREQLAQQFGVNATEHNRELLAQVDVAVLAVKPQVLRDVCQELAASLSQHRPLFLSVAAGTRAGDIERWLGGATALVRTMPNTPALVQSGATALFANSLVSEQQREQAEAIMRAVGLTLWVDDEKLMDAVTALSGSGPAYFFLVMEALEQAGNALGLPADTARLLALQTAFGASKMALESPDDCATLRQRVTSPGGTTEAALKVLEERDLRGIFEAALKAARDRGVELADMLGAE